MTAVTKKSLAPVFFVFQFQRAQQYHHSHLLDRFVCICECVSGEGSSRGGADRLILTNKSCYMHLYNKHYEILCVNFLSKYSVFFFNAYNFLRTEPW